MNIQVLRVERAEHDGNYVYMYRYPSARVVGRESEASGEQRRMTRVDHEARLKDAALALAAVDDHGHPPAAIGGLETLSRLGAMLAQAYLPQRVQDFLFASAGPLAIVTDDPAFPWELVQHPRHGLLGMYRPVGRILPDAPVPAPPVAGSGTLILGDTLDDRPPCREEAAWLATTLSASGWPAPDLRVGRARQADLAAALTIPRRLVHYIGHIAAQESEGLDGLAASDGILSAREFARIFGGAAYVHLGGCRSGRRARAISLGQGPGTRGLVGACFARGARVVVATLWPVISQSAFEFDRAFYQQLLAGMSFGAALQWCRAAFRAARPIDPTWGAYVLYGDPRHTLATLDDPALLETAVGSDPARAVTITPLVSGPGFQPLWISPRVRVVFSQIVADDEIFLDRAAHDALDHTLRWLERHRQPRIRRLNLLVGLAELPAGPEGPVPMVARGLRALGIAPTTMARLATRAFGMGTVTEEILFPKASPGAESALQRARRRALDAGRMVVTEDDLVTAVLEGAARGSLAVALDYLGLDAPILLAAARGEPVAPLPLGPRRMASYAMAMAREDVTPREVIRDLHDEIAAGTGPSGLADDPAVGRGADLREALRLMGRAERHHVALLGPPGVGKQTLALAILRQVARQEDPVRVGIFAGSDLFTLRSQRIGPGFGERLRRDLMRLQGRAILLLEDLPALAADGEAHQVLGWLAEHPQIHLLATGQQEAYLALARELPALAQRFTALTLAPPRDAAALAQVRTHEAGLATRYGVLLAPGVAEAAIAVAGEEAPLVLPGAAIERLHWACAIARNRPNLGSEIQPRAPSPTVTPLVTPDDVRQARLERM